MKNFSILSLCSTLLIFFGSYQACPAQLLDDELACMKDKLSKIPRENSDSILLLLNKAISLSEKRKDSTNLAFFYLEKGRLHRLKSHKMALENYFKAKEIYEAIDDQKGLHISNLCIGGIYSLDFQQRKELIRGAINYFFNGTDTMMLMSSYSTLAACYDQNKITDSTLHYMKLALGLSRKLNNQKAQAAMLNNIGAAYFALKNYPEALQCYNKALEIAAASGQDRDFLFHIKGNLMIYYFHRDQLDSALYYQALIKEDFVRIPQGKRDFYKELSDYYRRAGNTDKAFNYHLKADSVDDILTKERNASALDLLELEYQSKIKEDQMIHLNAEIEKAYYIRSLLIGIVLLTLLFSAALLWQQNLKSRKKRQLLKSERKLLEAELQNSELKRKMLNEELTYTNKELTSFATNIVQNHDIIDDIKCRIAVISKEKSLKNIREEIQELQIMLMQIFNNNAHRREFIKRSRQLNHSFIYHLQSNFPQLSESDINILILALLNFSSKEISVLYNVEENSIRQKRWRIRKKLPIGERESFEDFFKRIMPEMEIRLEA